jgi:hypothetical protein
MTLEFHPSVQNDFNAALDYYEAEGGDEEVFELDRLLLLLSGTIITL